MLAKQGDYSFCSEIQEHKLPSLSKLSWAHIPTTTIPLTCVTLNVQIAPAGGHTCTHQKPHECPADGSDVWLR